MALIESLQIVEWWRDQRRLTTHECRLEVVGFFRCFTTRDKQMVHILLIFTLKL